MGDTARKGRRTDAIRVTRKVCMSARMAQEVSTLLVAVRRDHRGGRPAGHRSRPPASCQPAAPAAGRHGGPRSAPTPPAAAFTAAVTLRAVFPPPAAISSCVRQTVGTDATRPSNSRWSPVIRKSLITCAPLATAQARSDSTRPAHAPASACWPALPTARQSAPSHPTVAAAAPAPRGTPLPPRRPGTVDDCRQPFVPDQVAPAR
jgi:hypothetical protein